MGIWWPGQFYMSLPSLQYKCHSVLCYIGFSYNSVWSDCYQRCTQLLLFITHRRNTHKQPPEPIFTQYGLYSRAVPDLFFPIRPEPDFTGLGWQIRPEPDFQIVCNFTNLTCKNITNVRVIWVFADLLRSSYLYDFLKSGFLTYLGILD